MSCVGTSGPRQSGEWFVGQRIRPAATSDVRNQSPGPETGTFGYCQSVREYLLQTFRLAYK
ncbi:MAG: hypothetical protein EA415_02285 [Sphaerobacteraceae bacterium]|nr:MAG: hypothetical protein EA415_02285 [Sphaerobacteraceae bacterium]